MVKELKMTIPLPPSVNSLYTNQAFFNPKTKSYQSTGKRILTKEGRIAKNRISAEARMAVLKNDWNINEVDDIMLYMDATIFFNRKGRDSDNIYKAIQDSLQGIVYNNDSQVLARTQKVMFDKDNPRVELTIKPVDFVGIFNDKEDREDFEARCEFGGTNGCSKYRNGRCSILQDSINGTIREEVPDINNPVCTAFKAKKG